MTASTKMDEREVSAFALVISLLAAQALILGAAYLIAVAVITHQ
jgi:hypothetical protein